MNRSDNDLSPGLGYRAWLDNLSFLGTSPYTWLLSIHFSNSTHHISNPVCVSTEYSHNSSHIYIYNMDFEIVQSNGQQGTAKTQQKRTWDLNEWYRISSTHDSNSYFLFPLQTYRVETNFNFIPFYVWQKFWSNAAFFYFIINSDRFVLVGGVGFDLACSRRSVSWEAAPFFALPN